MPVTYYQFNSVSGAGKEALISTLKGRKEILY